MGSRNIFLLIGAIFALFLTHVTPATAQNIYAVSSDSLSPLYHDDAEYEQDIASLTQLTEGDKRHGKPSLRAIVRRAEREWPRLLLRYAQPAVRGLLADRQTGSNTLAIKTTFFRDNAKGLHLDGGFGRNTWGEREARLQFSARF